MSSSPINGIEAAKVYREADCLADAAAVDAAFERMAADITRDLADKDPVVLCVMNGGLIPGGLLIPRLDFPLRLDYVHATRYRERTSGDELEWRKTHEDDLQGRHVLVIDDILDEGYTLAAIVEHCRREQAVDVKTAVLVEKMHERGNGYKADYVGMQIEDRYLFGCGMDYKGYLRNIHGVYAVKGL